MTAREAAVSLQNFKLQPIASRTLTTAATADTTKAYIVPATATDLWSGQSGKITFFDQVWRFVTPENGFAVFVVDEGAVLYHNGTTWGTSIALDAKNITTDTTTGTKVGTAATQKFGFFGVTPIVQPAGVAVTTSGFTAGSGAAVLVDSTFTGGSGTKAYHISDLVLALKNLGILAAS